MSSFVRTVYENCECTYTCGLSIRRFLRLLSVIGMISSTAFITVGACIIAHIVQTEKVEWFPNAYYRIPEANGPVASRIVVPRPPSGNNFEDYEIYRPRPNQHHPAFSFRPHYQEPVFPVSGDQFNNDRLGEQQQKAIYYRRNVGLFICLAASLIVINFIQLITDISLFYSTFKAKRTTSFWVFFLLNIILWIMTLICFVTIFSGGGIFLLLVFLTGTAIRVYTVCALHELMSDLRKPRDTSESGEMPEKEIIPEPRTLTDAEAGQCETADADEPEKEANPAPLDDEAPAEEEDDAMSSSKSLQPAQTEDEDEMERMVNEELQCAAGTTDDDEEEDGGEEPEDLIEELILESPNALEDIIEEPEEENSNEETGDDEGTSDEPLPDEAENANEENIPENEEEASEEDPPENAQENEEQGDNENENEAGENGEPDEEKNGEQENEEDGNQENANGSDNEEETEIMPPEGESASKSDETDNAEPDVSEGNEEQTNPENEDGEDDETTKEGENGDESGSQEMDSPAESGENGEEQAEAAEGEGDENQVKDGDETDSQKKRKKSKRRRKIKKT